MFERTHRFTLATTALVALGFAATAQTAAGPGATLSGASSGQITIDRIQATYSFAPGEVLVEGSGLDTVTEATLCGEPVTILAQTPTTLVLAPAPRNPGFPILRVTDGVDGASRNASMIPTLMSRTDGIGGRLRVRLANGGSGLFVLGYATECLSAPRQILNPPTWFGMMLDLDATHAILAADVFPSADARHLTFDVPDDPALAGMTIYTQAWCRQDFSGSGTTWSFTNLGHVTF